MAATLTTPPPAAALNGDGIYCQVNTDLVSSDASYFQIDISGSGPSDGQSLTLSWPTGTVTFTATDAPDGSAEQWPLKPSGQPLADYVDDIADFLRDGGLLSTAFNVTRQTSGGTESILVKHVINGVFTLAVDDNTMSGVVAVENNVTSDPPPANLRIQVNVHSSGVGASDVAGVELFATHAVTTASDAAPLLDIHPAFALLRPDLPETGSIVRPGSAPPSSWFNREASLMFQRYYIRYGEKYGTPALNGSMLRSTSTYTALLGAHSGAAKIPTGARRVCNDHFRRDNGIFRKPVHEDQPDWVYVYTGSFIVAEIEASLSVKIYWSDGTSSNHMPFAGGMPTLLPDRLYMFATGFLQLRLNLVGPSGATASDAHIVGYDVMIGPVNDDFAYLAVVRYDLASHAWWNFFVLFENGMGGLETAWLRGKTTERYGVEATEYQSPRFGMTRPVDFRDYANVGAQGRPAWETSTGWYDDPFYMIHLRQLTLARCWLIDVQNKRYLPVTVLASDSATTQDDETIHENTYKIEAGWYDAAANL